MRQISVFREKITTEMYLKSLIKNKVQKQFRVRHKEVATTSVMKVKAHQGRTESTGFLCGRAS